MLDEPTHVPEGGKLTIRYVEVADDAYKFKVEVSPKDTGSREDWPGEIETASFVYNKDGDQYSDYIPLYDCEAKRPPSATPKDGKIAKADLFDKLIHFAAAKVRLHDKTDHEDHELLLVPLDCADNANKDYCKGGNRFHMMFVISPDGALHNGVSHGDN
jgi:hypothetical protein